MISLITYQNFERKLLMNVLQKLSTVLLLTSSFFSSFIIAKDDPEQVERILNNFIAAEQVEKAWNDMFSTESTSADINKAFVASGKYSAAESSRESEELNAKITNHLRFKSIENILKKHLANNFSTDELEFITKKSLRIIPENESNNVKMDALMQRFDLCVRLTVREKLTELHKEEVF